MNRFVKLLVIIASAGLVLVLLIGTILAKDPEVVYRHLDVYTEVLSRIKSEYVEEPEMEDVTLGALNGLLESLDPYASYLSDAQYNQYLKDQKTKKADLGLMLSRKVGYVSVVDAIPGSPGDKAGLQTGDMIETIDGVATRNMPLAYAEMLLRGKAGSEVALSILRVRHSTEPQEVVLARAKFDYPPVRSQMLPGKIGHLRVESLEANKTAEVTKHLKSLTKQGAEKIILDLRRAASGDPGEGLALADLFLDEGLLAYLKGQTVPKEEFRATKAATQSRLPMVVVINRGTARGAEIAASALLENKHCEVVGERSYGDAALRRAVQMTDGGAVILSVAKYHTASDDSIQDKAVTPTVVSIARDPASESDERLDIRIEYVPEPAVADDTILQKAIEVLTKGVPKESAANADIDAMDGDPLRMTPLGVPKDGR